MRSFEVYIMIRFVQWSFLKVDKVFLYESIFDKDYGCEGKLGSMEGKFWWAPPNFNPTLSPPLLKPNFYELPIVKMKISRAGVWDPFAKEQISSMSSKMCFTFLYSAFSNVQISSMNVLTKMWQIILHIVCGYPLVKHGSREFCSFAPIF